MADFSRISFLIRSISWSKIALVWFKMIFSSSVRRSFSDADRFDDAPSVPFICAIFWNIPLAGAWISSNLCSYLACTSKLILLAGCSTKVMMIGTSESTSALCKVFLNPSSSFIVIELSDVLGISELSR